jgi:uncharacterized membrane protein
MSNNTIGTPKLGNALANFYLIIAGVLLVIYCLVLGCIPAILSWLAGEGFVHPFFEDEDEFD